MNTNRTKVLLAVVVALLFAGAITTAIILKHRATQAAEQAAKNARANTPARPQKLEPPAPAPLVVSDPAPISPKPRKQKEEIGDPKAREALKTVGANLAATDYWIAAINNPKLSNKERRELIEDLNDDGFANKKKLTLDDLPLIEARIVLIEALAPNALDQINADAFQEAYKDLTKMRARVTGQPEPPRTNLQPR